MRSGGLLLLRALAVLLLVFILLYFRPCLNDQRQAEWAHGIPVPESAINVQTVGDWRRGILDRGATTVLILESREVENFMSGLPDVSQGIGAGPPVNGVYHRGLDIPWKPEQKPIMATTHQSPVGDWLSVEVYRLSGEVSAIRLYTDWN